MKYLLTIVTAVLIGITATLLELRPDTLDYWAFMILTCIVNVFGWEKVFKRNKG